jgi:hypothetical protein
MEEPFSEGIRLSKPASESRLEREDWDMKRGTRQIFQQKVLAGFALHI